MVEYTPIDAQIWRARHDEDTPAPTDQDLETLSTGALVAVGFEVKAADGVKNQRIWLEVISIDRAITSDGTRCDQITTWDYEGNQPEDVEILVESSHILTITYD